MRGGRHVSTSCARCSAGAGSASESSGRAVKIEETQHPINRGSPRGLSGPQVLYDPDRVTGPLRRRKPRGEAATSLADWESVGWDEAIAELATFLRGLREAGEPHKLAIVSGRERGMTLELLRRFASVYGTPNLFDGYGSGNGPARRASFLMRGVRRPGLRLGERALRLEPGLVGAGWFLPARPLRAARRRTATRHGGRTREDRARRPQLVAHGDER
jgi:anaerobic selenocysteine-containing dehydrogenase